ncbi:hypothetical protein P175DRAFT_0532691 [Aspergillus ochraceoroseus IBT 24754]|uniref:Cupin 2 conserved barrel domain-containing protein n=1 Tax=Aspergillus ochraceoroseus IBT 24754 TaxID=1392256 RepID=A0A2T5LTY3_9EURO|nr:uncharacterized protein P175DRAFT_0532691 [Aspergillus ochraceoroseus IBT 24754]PTU19746.1 hypothetical protein P175DRAFT_0532691 [Aspergillus ochraceoroseus IBT 24754]
MPMITELIDSIPEASEISHLQHDENLFLQSSDPNDCPMSKDSAPLAAIHSRQDFVTMKFGPPRDIYGGNSLRLEWQQMDNRQPFYHRNGDAYEISYQVSGERTLITGLGSIKLHPGEFCLIPPSVTHDNYGRREVHILFYIFGPVEESGKITGIAELKPTPFDGWSPQMVTEMYNTGLGETGCDFTTSTLDEVLLTNGRLNNHPQSHLLLTARQPLGLNSEPEWVYKSPSVWIGGWRLEHSPGHVYYRHSLADAIQCQIRGKRLVVSQRGMILMEPGDFISIPRGCAYTSIISDESFHIQILTTNAVIEKAELSKTASEISLQFIQAAREKVSG